MSNPNAAHATCKYAWIRSGSMVVGDKREGNERNGAAFSKDLGWGLGAGLFWNEVATWTRRCWLVQTAK